MPPSINAHKIVIFTGAGISAESGIKTFRGDDGLWLDKDPMETASVKAWKSDPNKVIEFHNQRLVEIEKAQPNIAHTSLADLEKHFEVVIITQNVDNLHERAGSSNVIHLHGSETEVYPDGSPELVEHRGYRPISLDEQQNGKLLRPNVVLFGEEIHHYREAVEHMKTAARILVVGTSLAVEPAASILKKSRFHAERVIISLKIEQKPYGFKFINGKAGEWVPHLTNKWIAAGPKSFK